MYFPKDAEAVPTFESPWIHRGWIPTSFSFSISPSHEYSGLISFRIDWLALLAVQGTLKSLLPHHSSEAPHGFRPQAPPCLLFRDSLGRTLSSTRAGQPSPTTLPAPRFTAKTSASLSALGTWANILPSFQLAEVQAPTPEHVSLGGSPGSPSRCSGSTCETGLLTPQALLPYGDHGLPVG